MENPKKISIQGYKGSFHHIVAQKVFGAEVPVLERGTFEEVFKDVLSETVHQGIVAVENTITGSILASYDLLLKYRTKLGVVGEFYLPIHQNLVALKGGRLGAITEVRSHPIALKQCVAYLKTLNAKLVECEDTALAAKEIKENNLVGVAAVASLEAAELYDLEVLAHQIETDKKNHTRFFVIQRRMRTPIEGANKTSVIFEVEDKAGALAKVLGCFLKLNVNITKLESRQIVSRPWEYHFYLDYECDADNSKGRTLLDSLKENTLSLIILGSYKNRLRALREKEKQAS